MRILISEKVMLQAALWLDTDFPIPEESKEAQHHNPPHSTVVCKELYFP